MITLCASTLGGVDEVRAGVRRRVLERHEAGDAHLFLVEGPLLMPPSMLVEGLHPSAAGKAELAANLHAELGLSHVQHTLRQCEPFELLIDGLSPHGECILIPFP